MASIEEVRAQIAFQLDRLSTLNAHHEFEHLCEDLARVRICTNIMPPTGPVSAGGDQGRDLETFITHIKGSPIANSTFVGLVSEEPIAFACSLNKKYKAKIKSDVKTIFENGFKGKEVHFFSSQAIPTAVRHELEDWAQKEYQCTLQIHDAESIATLLSDQEVFWIATQYLSISADIYPRSEDEDSWYEKTLKNWKEKTEIKFLYADFAEVQSALRHATFSKEAKQDLPFWIGILEKFIETTTGEKLKHRAQYEVLRASLRGMGTMVGREEMVRDYFAKADQRTEMGYIEDAVALLSYCFGAQGQGLLNIPQKEIVESAEKLEKVIRKELDAQPGENYRCVLLESLGYLIFVSHSGASFSDRLDEAFVHWLEVAELAKKARLFHLERFSDALTTMVPLIGEHEKYRELADKVDTLLTERFGKFKAAEKCADRAEKFQESGKILKAIDEIHHAKVEWFAQERLEGTLICLLVLAESYRDLGLNIAAKYFALMAASLAIRSEDAREKAMTGRALLLAADCDYLQGQWCGYLNLLRSGMTAFHIFDKGLGEKRTNRTIFHTCLILLATERFDKPLADLLKEKIKEWGNGLYEAVIEMLDALREDSEKQTDEKIWSLMQKDLIDRPFSDLGKKRSIRWSALGINWTVTFENTYDTTAVVEQFIATLQVWLADIAEKDLCLMSTDIHINVTTAKIEMPEVESESSNESRSWELQLPEKGHVGTKHPDEWHGGIFAAAIIILKENSLLPEEQFEEMMIDCIRRGISMKTFFGRSYEEVFGECYDREFMDDAEKSKHSPLRAGTDFELKSHPDLEWNDTDGPNYSEKESKDAMKTRYESCLKWMPITLAALRKDKGFLETVKKLRSEGWKDGHILNAIAGVALNARLKPKMQFLVNEEQMREATLRLKKEGEKETDTPLSPALFTEDAIKMATKMSMLSTVRGWQLEIRQRTPNFKAIDEFLRRRYHHWDDDVAHDDPFKEP